MANPIYFSKVWTLFITFPILETLNVKINAKMITGSPVANANIEGIKIPSEKLKARGINTPKNKTAEKGQKAKANKTPKRKVPKYPFSESFSFILFILFPDFSEGNFIIFNIISPIKINKGPKIFSPYFCKNKEIV